MSSCTAAEIADKKRIALEKLKAKKAQLTSASSSNNNNGSNANKSTINNSGVTSGASSTIQQSSVRADNSASSFLSAVKVSQNFVQCQQPQRAVRDSVHPYKRPSIYETYKKYSNRFSKKQKLAGGVTCKVEIISPQRFEIQPSSYHAKLVDIFRTIPSKSYDRNTRCWDFSLSDYKLLQKRIDTLKPTVVMGVIPKNVLNLCLSPPKALHKTCLEFIEPVLAEKLMPFQQDGVCFAISQQGRCMIGDEMGLGKTYQAIAVADFYRDSWPLLICTTASTRDSWFQHIRELLPSIPLHNVQVLSCNQQYMGDCKVLITSYSMMERYIDLLMEHKFGCLIFDESQNIKNSKAKCTIAADRLSQQAKHVLLLSGTPALSRPLELFTQLQMIDRKFMTFMEFTSRYCDGIKKHFGWDATGQSNLRELNVILKLKYMIRRTKAEVLQDLAQKSRETVVLDPALVWPSDEVKETLNNVAKDLHTCQDADRERILIHFYAQTGEVKAKAVCAYLTQQVKEPEKFIVFAHHHVMMDAISDCLNKLKVKYIRIDGSTPKHDRGEYIETFQKNRSYKVALLSLVACNSGITLTAAELIIFAELTWNPSTLAQAESRAHRIGQTKPVTVRYLMATKTADDDIWIMLKNKQDTLKKAGLFCDNLQDATHTAASTTSDKVDKYFSPTKTDAIKVESNNSLFEKSSPVSNNNSSASLDISKEIENIHEFFKDDDDEAFKDLMF